MLVIDTPYDEYSKHWKEQSHGASELLTVLVDQVGEDEILSLDLLDPRVRSQYGLLVHNNWISRNELVKHLEWVNPNLTVLFDELSEVEQQKHRRALAALQNWFAKNKS